MRLGRCVVGRTGTGRRDQGDGGEHAQQRSTHCATVAATRRGPASRVGAMPGGMPAREAGPGRSTGNRRAERASGRVARAPRSALEAPTTSTAGTSNSGAPGSLITETDPWPGPPHTQIGPPHRRTRRVATHRMDAPPRTRSTRITPRFPLPGSPPLPTRQRRPTLRPTGPDGSGRRRTRPRSSTSAGDHLVSGASSSGRHRSSSWWLASPGCGRTAPTEVPTS